MEPFDFNGYFPAGGFRFNVPPGGLMSWPSFAAMQAAGGNPNLLSRARKPWAQNPAIVQNGVVFALPSSVRARLLPNYPLIPSLARRGPRGG